MQIISTKEAYSDFTASKDLARYNFLVDRCVVVDTTASNFKLAIFRHNFNRENYSIYLLDSNSRFKTEEGDQNQVVGIVSINEIARGRLVTPSCYLIKSYRKRGLAKMIYQWLLDTGFSLITNECQSRMSHRLWKSLARQNPLLIVDCFKDEVLYSGEKSLLKMCHKKGENVLVGKGWTINTFANDYGFEFF